MPPYRTRAKVVWISLLMSILAYTVWQIINIVIKRANPSTSLAVTDDLYNFPLVHICLALGFGCDADLPICIASALEFVAPVEYGGETINGTINENHPDCLEFDLTTFDVGGGDKASSATASLWMAWLVGDDVDSEQTFTESVDLFLGGITGGVGIAVPYSRIDFSEGDLLSHLTAMTIGKTTRTFLSGDSITTFPVLTLSTIQTVQKNQSNFSSDISEYTLGFVILDITQGSFSRKAIRDIDPLEITTFFGNIGGFWELMIVVWALCFVGYNRESVPALTARNFTESFQQGKNAIARRKTVSAKSSSEPEPCEGRPDWESAYKQSGSIGMPRRPQSLDFPQRGFRCAMALGDDGRNNASRLSIGSSNPSTKATTTNTAAPPSQDELQPV